eukprot:m.173870 g.173870  ORF g.173870 m.173870 type:complete len:330 (+) comp13502_c1_seq48:118-1107(+)
MNSSSSSFATCCDGVVGVLERVELMKPKELRRFIIDPKEEASRMLIINAAVSLGGIGTRSSRKKNNNNCEGVELNLRAKRCLSFLFERGMYLPFIQMLMRMAINNIPFRSKLLLLPRNSIVTKYIFNEHFSSLFNLDIGDATNCLVLLEWVGLEGVEFPLEEITDSAIQQYFSTATMCLQESPSHAPLLYVSSLLVERCSREMLPVACKAIAAATDCLQSEGILEQAVSKFSDDSFSLYGAHVLEDATYSLAVRLLVHYGYGLVKTVNRSISNESCTQYIMALCQTHFVNVQRHELSPCLPFPPTNDIQTGEIMAILDRLEKKMLDEWL